MTSCTRDKTLKGSKKFDYVCFRNNTYFGKAVFSSCERLRTALFTDCTDELSEQLFAGCPKLTIFGKYGIAAENYARENDIPFIGSVISSGEQSTVVVQAQQTATVRLNGVDIPAYTVNSSVYVGESAYRCLGFIIDCDGEVRTTTITVPENAEWSVKFNTNSSPYLIDVVSSDVEFLYNGFRMLVMNVGNGKSIIYVNALAEKCCIDAVTA